MGGKLPFPGPARLSQWLKAQAGSCLIQQTTHPDPHVLSLLGTLGAVVLCLHHCRARCRAPGGHCVSRVLGGVHPSPSEAVTPPTSCFLQKRQEGPGLGASSLLTLRSLLTPQRSPKGPALLPLRPGGIIDLVAQAAPVSPLVPFLGTSDGPRALPRVSSQPRTFSATQGLF